MKGSRSLVMSLISVLLSLVTLMAASFAWLSSNKEVGSNGMEMQVDTTANLVISATEAGISDSTLSFVDFSSTPNDNKYKPTTHSDGWANTTTGLHHVTNTGDVNYTSGLPTSYSYADSVNATGAKYYEDYVVFIASAGKGLSDATLIAEITSATKNSTAVTGTSTLMATSIDLYVGDVNASNFKGTLNVATKSTHSVSLFGMTGGTPNNPATGDIPLNKTGFIKVTMRVYFDGALLIEGSDPQTTYINSATLDTSKVSINVKFTATGNDA